MAMAWFFTIAAVFSVVYGTLSGNAEAVGTAALEGAGAAIELSIGICGVTCLWSGVMEVMRKSGLSGNLSRLFRPVLTRLFPDSRHDSETMEAVSANVSANLLGLGNAATPLGIKAAELMARRTRNGIASNDLCTLVVLNAGSLQLIPATIAAIRASAGAKLPFDILPAVWITTAASLTAGLVAAKVLGKLWGRGGK